MDGAGSLPQCATGCSARPGCGTGRECKKASVTNRRQTMRLKSVQRRGIHMTRLRIVSMVAALVLAAAVAPAAAQQTLGATFSGYAENPTLNSSGSGTLTLTISE